MLLKHLNHLNSKRIILASGSPRRKEILESINLKFEVIPSTFEENMDPKDFPNIQEYVMQTAFHKAEDVAKKEPNAELVISADTLVYLNGEILGKPKENRKAKDMLKRLSGKTHQVYTGVVLMWPQVSVTRRFYEMTNVTFAILDEETIDLYVASGEPMDKAGGYGIQGVGATMIEGIQGDYYTVVGLPLHRFCATVGKHYDDILANANGS